MLILSQTPSLNLTLILILSQIIIHTLNIIGHMGHNIKLMDHNKWVTQLICTVISCVAHQGMALVLVWVNISVAIEHWCLWFSLTKECKSQISFILSFEFVNMSKVYKLQDSCKFGRLMEPWNITKTSSQLWQICHSYFLSLWHWLLKTLCNHELLSSGSTPPYNSNDTGKPGLAIADLVEHPAYTTIEVSPLKLWF